MTEEDARGWIAARFGDEAVDRLGCLAAMVRDEAIRQNLVAASTLDQLWSRHILDSAQLIDHAPPHGQWIDIGTGGGFPGLVVAMLRPEPTLLVEPRRLRAGFLTACVDRLALSRTAILAARIEQCRTVATVLSARAVASIEKLLHAARHCATRDTRWLLPRGLISVEEQTRVQERWAGMFHVERSVVDPGSAILVIDGPHPR